MNPTFSCHLLSYGGRPEFAPGAQTGEEERETLQWGGEVPDWFAWS